MEKPGESHPVTPGTAASGISHVVSGGDLETTQNSRLCELRIDYLIEDG